MDILVIGGAIVIVGLVIAVAIGRRGGAPDNRVNPLHDQLVALSERVKTLAESQINGQTAITKLLEERLEKVSHRMGQSLADSATKTAESLGKLNKHLSVIDQAQKNLTDLSGQVVTLQDILANKQARGAFGEIQLADIVTAALPPSAFQFQVTLSNGKRADCVLRLPNPPGVIVVDAKFPLESFNALREAHDDGAKKKAVRAFRSDLLKHVQDIAARYIVPGETAESALMFLPSESVYAELHTNFIDVVRKSYGLRVWIVSPTTLMATLNTVRAVLKDVRMREQAHVIQIEVAKMADDVVRLQDRVDKLQKHFRQADQDINDIQISASKIANKADRIEHVQLEDDEAHVAEPIDTASNVTPLQGRS